MQLDDAATIIAQADFFEVCDGEQRRLLAFASERKRYRPGTVIYQGGEVPEGAHILISGTVSTTREGREENPYLSHDPGVVFGATALVVPRPRAVTMKAVDTVETLFIPRNAFLKLLHQYPELVGRVADRIRGDLTGYIDAVKTLQPRMGGKPG